MSHDDRKREILRAAATVFRRHGVHQASTREIAAEAGMTVGNLYYYFKNKQALLAFCQEDGLTGLLALAQEVEALPRPASERLFRLVAGHVERLNEGTPGSLAHLEIEGLDGAFRKSLVARRQDYEATLRRLIAAGVEAGELRPVDPKIAALAILGTVNWTVKWFRPEGPKKAGQIGLEIADFVVRGLLAPDFAWASPCSKSFPKATTATTSTTSTTSTAAGGRADEASQRPSHRLSDQLSDQENETWRTN